jgi:hypothetical protein
MVDREPVVVRAAQPGDADQLNEIYNHYYVQRPT